MEDQLRYQKIKRNFRVAFFRWNFLKVGMPQNVIHFLPTSRTSHGSCDGYIWHYTLTGIVIICDVVSCCHFHHLKTHTGSFRIQKKIVIDVWICKTSGKFLTVLVWFKCSQNKQSFKKKTNKKTPQNSGNKNDDTSVRKSLECPIALSQF